MDRNLRLTKSQTNLVIGITSTFVMNTEEDLYSSSSNNDSSESNFSSDEENGISTLYAILMVGETRGPSILCEKLTNYVERVVPGYSR